MPDPVRFCRRLECHSATPSPAAVRQVRAELALEGPRVLAVRFHIEGDIAALRVPDVQAPLDPERLWEHTCGELFIAPLGRDDYIEWNFSPNGQFNRFAFSSYRHRLTSSAPVGANSSMSTAPHELRLEALAPVNPDVGDFVRISLAAVIEDAHGTLSYWAMRHPCDQPDFHHRGGFLLACPLVPWSVERDQVESP